MEKDPFDAILSDVITFSPALPCNLCGEPTTTGTAHLLEFEPDDPDAMTGYHLQPVHRECFNQIAGQLREKMRLVPDLLTRIEHSTD